MNKLPDLTIYSSKQADVTEWRSTVATPVGGASEKY